MPPKPCSGCTDRQRQLQQAQEERDKLKFRADSYPCDRCGADYGMDASLPNSEWKAISGGNYDILCLWCIEELAQEKGLSYTAYLYFPGKAGRSALYEGDKDERWPELLDQARADRDAAIERAEAAEARSIDAALKWMRERPGASWTATIEDLEEVRAELTPAEALRAEHRSPQSGQARQEEKE